MSNSPPDYSHPSESPGFPGNGRRRPGPLPRCRLILLNNENADLMLVVRTIMDLTHFCRYEATHKMWQAHHCGQALLLVTHRERAELYVEQFADKGLKVTVEAAG